MGEANVELARRGYEAALRGDLDTVREFLRPDVRWHGGDPTAPGACRGREQALAFLRRARAQGRIGELVEVIDAGEKVVVIMRRPSPNGDADDLIANLTTFEHGQAVEMIHFPDRAQALIAAGVAP